VPEEHGHFFAAGIESFCWPEEPSYSASSGVKPLFTWPEEFGSHYKKPLASARRTQLILYFRHRIFLSIWGTQPFYLFRCQALFTIWRTRILLRRTPCQWQKNMATSLLQESNLFVGLRNLLLRLSRRRKLIGLTWITVQKLEERDYVCYIKTSSRTTFCTKIATLQSDFEEESFIIHQSFCGIT